jgi:hypothetical protein
MALRGKGVVTGKDIAWFDMETGGVETANH